MTLPIARLLVAAVCGLAAVAPVAVAQCVVDPVDRASLPYDFDYLFAGLDLTLGASFPDWLDRYNQVNTGDPSAAFGSEDNSQNGIEDDDQLAMLAAVLDGEPVGEALAGVAPANVTAIRASYTANRAKVRPDLTLQILFIQVNIIDEINADDPEFGASLQDLVAAYMTLGDAESLAFIRGLLITLGEIFIEQGVASGDIPGFVEGLVKDTLRSTVNGNFVATRYDCYGDAPGAAKPNLLGDTGSLGGSANTNEAEYAAQGGDRAAWLLAKGVARPPLEILSAPGDLSVIAGTPLSFAVAVSGGDGSTVRRDWKRVTLATGATSPRSTADTLEISYPLPGDSGGYGVFVCDDTWVRSSQPFTLTVTAAPFAITTQPTGASRTVGDDYTFSVAVRGGDAVPTYQWQRGPTSASLVDIPGATEPSLRLEDIQLSDAGLYRVVVRSGDTVLESSRVGLVVGLAPDTTPPVLTLLGADPLALACGAPFEDPGATALDAVSGDLTASIQASGTVNSAVPGTYTRTYTVADAAGNVGQAQRSVVVSDAVAPTITVLGPDPLVLACGSAFVDPGAAANDACAGGLSGALSAEGAVDVFTPGDYLVTYRVADPSGNPAEATRTVQVRDTAPPTLTLLGPNPLVLACGAAFNDPGVEASDACAGDLSGAVEAAGAVNTAVPGDYTRTYSVTDPAGNPAQVTRSVQVRDAAAPVLTLNGPDPLDLACGAPFNDPGATATDPCAGDLSGAVEASGTVDTAVPGDYTRTYTVEDPSGNRAEITRTVRVRDSSPPTVTLIGPATLTLECGAVFDDPGATGTDGCDTALAPVTVEGAVDPATPGDYPLTYRATDASGNAGTASRIVTVRDSTPPTLTLLGSAEMQVECGTAFTDPGVTASDTCGGDLGATVQVQGAVDSATPGDYNLVYTVTDASGNTAEVSRSVRVTDSTPPVIGLFGASVLTVACGGAFEDPGAGYSDACDGEPEIAFLGEGDVETAVPGDYTVTYRLADSAGNESEVTRTVRVVDAVAPVVALRGPASVVLSCGEPYEEQGATASDGCDGDLGAALVAGDPVNTGAPGVYTVVYTATDAAGNTGQTQRQVTVQNDCAIAILRQPASLRMYPGTTATFQVLAAGGAGPLDYTWSKDGEPLESPGGDRLVLAEVDFEDAGTYRCVITDGLSVVETEPATLEVFARAESGQQSADLDGDWAVSLSELLRVIQLYNLGEFGCDATSEDGYAPGAQDRGCAPHNTDYNPQDWRIALTELLRAVQFYNTPGGLYHREEGTEDGLAPGAG